MLRQKATLIARIVYFVDLALTTLAFFLAFYLRNLIFPLLDPERFPTGLYPLSEYLKIYPIVLIIWSVLLFTYHSYHSHRTIPLTREMMTTLRIVIVGNCVIDSRWVTSHWVPALSRNVVMTCSFSLVSEL